MRKPFVASHGCRPPVEVQTSFASTMLGWKGTTLYLVLTGCPGSECPGGLTQRLAYRVDDSGAVALVDSVPKDLEHPPGSIARAFGERVYTRVSNLTDSIKVMTDDGGPWLVRFVLDRDGELVPVRQAAP